MHKLIIICFFLFSVFIPQIYAGALDLGSDAPIILQTTSWLLGFFSKSIQSQAVAYSVWFVTVMVGIQSIARGVAEVLGFFASKTKTTADDKALFICHKIIEITGKIIGWFGVGYPKSLR